MAASQHIVLDPDTGFPVTFVDNIPLSAFTISSTPAVSIDIQGLRLKHASAFNTMQREHINFFILRGRNFNMMIKKKREAGVVKLTLSGIPIVISGEPKPTDLTKQRFMAIVHQLNHEKPDTNGARTKSALITGWEPTWDNDFMMLIDLIGSGFQFQWAYLKARYGHLGEDRLSAFYMAVCFLLDFTAYLNTGVEEKMDIEEFLESGHNQWAEKGSSCLGAAMRHRQLDTMPDETDSKVWVSTILGAGITKRRTVHHRSAPALSIGSNSFHG